MKHVIPSKNSAFSRLISGDQTALARAITLIETGGENADRLAARLYDHAGNALVVAVTGPPGAGKSTLINAYVSALRRQGAKVAVLAVDPSSPFSGGAVLGDRTRMGEHSIDPNVFIRSIASRGCLGGLSLQVPSILDAVDAAGWPTIVLETVGAGQQETEIAEFADIKIVVNAPGLGDDIQAIKAGILEIADILVVNKSDMPLADRTVHQLKAMLELREIKSQDIPIISTNAITGDGLDDLTNCVSHLSDLPKNVWAEQKLARRLRGALFRRALHDFQNRLRTLSDKTVNELCAQVKRQDLSISEAASRLSKQQIQNS